jgi:hypothetical protein
MLIAIQLFVQGDSLQPAAITQLLGVEPQTAHSLGDSWTGASGKPLTRKVGLWKWGLSQNAENVDLSALALSFHAKLKHSAGQISRLPNAERTWIDVYISRETSDGGATEIAFELSTAALNALNAFELPIEFTTDCITAEAKAGG